MLNKVFYRLLSPLSSKRTKKTRKLYRIMTTGFARSRDSIYSVTLAYCFAGSYNGIGSYRTLVKFPQYRRICSREHIQRKKTDITRKAMSVFCFYGSGLYHRFFCPHNPEQSNSAKIFSVPGRTYAFFSSLTTFASGAFFLTLSIPLRQPAFEL